MRDKVYPLFLVAGLATFSMGLASAAPPESCAQKFVGSWTVRVIATGQTYPAQILPDGTTHVTCPLCIPVGTWTCSGDTINVLAPIPVSHTISPDGRTMTGGCCVLTRIGAPPAATKQEPKELVQTKQEARNQTTKQQTKRTAAAEPSPLVASKDGRLQAIALPGAAWCGEVVGILLKSKPGLLDSDPAAVQKFMAGVRVAVGAECPNANGIRFIAADGDRVVFRAYSSKSAGWAIHMVPQGTSGPRPAVPVLNDNMRREIARIDAGFLNALAGARHVTFAKDAQPAHAAWRISNVALGLTIRDLDNKEPVALKDVVEITSRQAANSCGNVKQISFGGTDAKVARQTFVCHQPPNSYAYGILAYVVGEQQYMVGLYSADADADNGSNLISVASAFERIITTEW